MDVEKSDYVPVISLKGINKNFKVKMKNSTKSFFRNFFDRKFEKISALKDLSLDINEAEIVGYIGPNGAGKSSSIKIMCGILKPDSGQCIVNGVIPWKNRVKNAGQIGVVFGQRSQLWWDVPVIDSFELLKEIYKIPNQVYENNLKELVELLKIESIIKMPLRQLSLGQRMRCEFVAVLLHNPKILFLDEPTIGLDSMSKVIMRNFIKKINSERKITVVLTTHDMQDIEALANRIVLIAKGSILFDGSIEQFKELALNNKVIKIKHTGGILPERDNLTIDMISDFEYRVKLNSKNTDISEVIRYITDHLNISDMSISEVNLEDVVVQIYKGYGL